MEPFGIYTKFQTAPECREELVAILLRAAEAVSGADGCRLFIVNRDSADDSATWVTELWDSREQHQASLELPGSTALIEKALPLLAARPEQIQLVPVGGTGVQIDTRA